MLSRRALVCAAIAAAACGRTPSPPAATQPTLAPPFDATACVAMTPRLLAINGDHPGNHLGYRVSTGDWDGDGFDDVLVSGGIEPGGTGTCAFLFYGKSLQSRIKFSLPVFNNQTSRGGPSVAFLGDVDGGGRADIAIGDPYWTNDHGTASTDDDVKDAGRVLVFLGEHAPPAGTTLVLDDAACGADISLEYDGQDPMWFGLSLAGGNVAGEADDPLAAPGSRPQYADLVVGAPGSDETDAAAVPGKVFVFLGGPHDPPGRLALAGRAAAAGFCAGTTRPVRVPASAAAFRQWTGSAPRDRFGLSVAVVGDVFPAGGDGYDDVLIGAPAARFTAYGRTAFLDALRDGAGNVLPGSAEVWSAAKDRVARLAAPVAPGKVVSMLGWSVSPAGDVDGDGQPDFVVGAPGYGDRDDGSTRPAMNAGAVYVYGGRCDASGNFPLLAGPVTLASIGNAREAPHRGDLFGFSVAGRLGHDLDGDLRDELLVGTPLGDNPRVPNNPCGCSPTGWELGGRAYLLAFHGDAAPLSPLALAVYRAEAPKDGFGWSLALGNILHDAPAGKLAAVCGAPRNAADCSKGTEEGELDVFFGEDVRVP